jgi:hypothetical protein
VQQNIQNTIRHRRQEENLLSVTRLNSLRVRFDCLDKSILFRLRVSHSRPRPQHFLVQGLVCKEHREEDEEGPKAGGQVPQIVVVEQVESATVRVQVAGGGWGGRGVVRLLSVENERREEQQEAERCAEDRDEQLGAVEASALNGGARAEKSGVGVGAGDCRVAELCWARNLP